MRLIDARFMCPNAVVSPSPQSTHVHYIRVHIFPYTITNVYVFYFPFFKYLLLNCVSKENKYKCSLSSVKIVWTNSWIAILCNILFNQLQMSFSTFSSSCSQRCFTLFWQRWPLLKSYCFALLRWLQKYYDKGVMV